MKEKTYIAIDLKSFYASVECAERGLDPLDANLVVADESRTDKTICLAVSPALKAHGISGRARLFEAKQRIKDVNRERKRKAPEHQFRGKSIFGSELASDPSLELDLVIAPPRMAYYMDYSKSIVEIYMRYVSFDDILVYSIDEVFIDATPYLSTYNKTARDFAMMLIQEVLKETRITATAGIGSNMYLAKIAMDIVAKHIPADKDGVRIAELDEMSYRDKLWTHKPLTDFWRVGNGIARKLEQNGLYTMGDIARCSEGKDTDYYNEDLLYKLFGVNAELLIDHAWGWEPTVISDCKAYKPESKSLNQGQVLSCPYSADQGKTVVMEMADQLSIDLVRAGLFTNQVVLDVGYDIENLTDSKRAAKYKGAIVSDHYGRQVPKAVHGSRNLGRFSSSTSRIVEAAAAIYDSIVDKNLLVRRFTVAVTHLVLESEAEPATPEIEQLDLFTDYEAVDKQRQAEEEDLERELKIQKALINIRDRYGKNAIVKGLNMKKESTAMERNKQIGGHKA
ncbi:DNA methylase [Neglecta sp. X4]|uniref:Y-family DNA polymerase n=1 Tax=unclassified Neglectibacter TaxID=2632164 RepID=UPI0013701BC7|nr:MULTISPECIES: DNA methylase [unclassified Neglectibacter]NBI16633.1 DNA methylase [Neglectibacter sp. 59]NBJ72913.1 DNA methylase [Neglectibacter sp. X4]NCE80891.1 DNA methylase [Neglectibacter sp. X58]